LEVEAVVEACLEASGSFWTLTAKLTRLAVDSKSGTKFPVSQINAEQFPMLS
jgi:hypothetical protein